MNLLYLGTGAFGIPALDALANAGFTPSAVVTGPDKPQGRSLQVKSSAVKDWALRKQIAVLEMADPNTEASRSALSARKPDLFIVIAYGALLSRETLAIPSRMCLNVHASLLPAYRGAAPIHWALLNGEKETGVSVIRMTESLDAGDVLSQKKTPIRPEDDFFSLEQRLSTLGAEALVEAVRLVRDGKAAPMPQDPALASRAPKIKKENGRLDWSKPAQKLADQVRALKKWPGSYCAVKGKRLIVTAARVAAEAPSRPGSVVAASPPRGLVVSCGEGSLELLTVQLEGKKELSAAEFLKGFALKAGELLE